MMDLIKTYDLMTEIYQARKEDPDFNASKGVGMDVVALELHIVLSCMDEIILEFHYAQAAGDTKKLEELSTEMRKVLIKLGVGALYALETYDTMPDA